MIDAPYNETELRVAAYLHDVPAPIRGGTFFYCPWFERGRGYYTTCGVRKYNWATGSRFRTAAAYRRHYRKYHS
jgi:hypothetical protein